MIPYNSRNNLELEVADFGPIAEAKIDLRPLTVFAGPSNTGKSYLAMLIYALHKFFHVPATIRSLDKGTVFSAPEHFNVEQLLSPEYRDVVGNWAREIIAKTAQEGDFPKSLAADLPEPVANLVRLQLGYISEYANELDDRIAHCFGVENTNNLVRNQVHGGARVNMMRRVSGSGIPADYMGIKAIISGSERAFESVAPNDASLSIAIHDIACSYPNPMRPWHWGLYRFQFQRDDTKAVTLALAEGVGSYMVNPLDRQAYYLPADRAGVMHAHRVVVSSLVRSAARAGLRREDPLPAVSGVLADFLEQLIQLGEPRRERRGDDTSLAERLERDVLKGEVLLKESVAGYPMFSYRPEGWKEDLPLMNASSMVSELSPVVLYLRHVVRPGEVLIIEEPESHLHPAMQVEFIRQLAGVVRAGIRVMLTTHSEWVLEELANLVRLADLPEAKREGIPGSDVFLNPGDVGVWGFQLQEDGEGSVVKEIHLDVESGVFPVGFGLITEDIYNRWAEIDSRIGRITRNMANA